jgi:hypothetical protein
MKNYLDKSIARILACDQVTELNELTELTTLHKTLNTISSLMCNHFLGRTYIHEIGGIESVIKVMKTFPKCRALQVSACSVIYNYLAYNINAAKVMKESDGIEVLLAALNNHYLSSAEGCDSICWSLCHIVCGSRENNILLDYLSIWAVSLLLPKSKSRGRITKIFKIRCRI